MTVGSKNNCEKSKFRLAYIAIFLIGLLFTSNALAFSFLGYRGKENPIKWTDDCVPLLDGGLIYSVDSDFFGGDADKRDAVKNALDTWSYGGSSAYFNPSFGQTIHNTDQRIIDIGLENSYWNWRFGGEFDAVVEGDEGLGSNVDVFSMTAAEFEQTYNTSMGGALARTVITNCSDQMFAVDVVFNEDYANWTTAGTGGLDVESVALHEIGHALGLDHPELAPSGYNFNPVTYEPENYNGGWENTIMWHEYEGVRRELQQEDAAGISYLYGEGSPPPPVVGAIFDNVHIQNMYLYPTGSYNDMGSFDLSDPGSSHVDLGNALVASGLQVDHLSFMFNEGTSQPTLFFADVCPQWYDVVLSFDLALLSGDRISENAHLIIGIEGIEIFRLDFADYDLADMIQFEAEEGYRYRTDFMHFDVAIDVPDDAFNYWFDYHVIIYEDAGDTGSIPPLGQIPEPCTIFYAIASLIAGVAVLKSRRAG